MDRRKALKLGCAACGSLVLGNSSGARAQEEDGLEFVSVLMDPVTCTGCLKCEAACAEANGLPIPDINDKTVLENHRRTNPDRFTVVNRHRTTRGDFFVKTQCMHCNQPGCASACLVRAMEKTREGPVTWNGRRCMGCRYCMIACPFNIPKFQYDRAVPDIRKCTLCHQRLQKGQIPACVEACPVEALHFGSRRGLVEVARTRIYSNPDRYFHEIYGEHVVGGTSWLYLSPVPFEELGFRTDLGTTPVPELTKEFLYAVPIVLLLWPAFLYGVSQRNKESGKTLRETTLREGE